MRDIAEKANVSVATVSRAMRNDPRQSQATRDRIQKLILDLGYSPDPFISAWVSKRWGRVERELGTIAWITIQAGRISWDEFKSGAEARARQLGYRLEEFKLKNVDDNIASLNRILISRGIGGVCIAPLPEKGGLALAWENFACATIGHSLEEPHLHRVSPDQSQGMELALQKLLAAGYRKIGLCLDRRVNIKVNRHWQARALLFAEEHPDCRLSTLMVDKSEPADVLDRWFRRVRPEVIVGSAGFVQGWARKLGIEVPIVLLSWTPDERCAGVDERRAELGGAAVDLVIEQLRRNERGVPAVPKLVLVEGVWRESEKDDKPGTKPVGKAPRRGVRAG